MNVSLPQPVKDEVLVAVDSAPVRRGSLYGVQNLATKQTAIGRVVAPADRVGTEVMVDFTKRRTVYVPGLPTPLFRFNTKHILAEVV